MQIPKCDNPRTLDIKTRALLKASALNLVQMALAYQIPYVWLKKYAAGSIDKPNVNRVQYLYEKLSGTKLDVKI